MSYKEESDYTDSDDLIQVDYSTSNAGADGAAGGGEDEGYEDEGEVIEKVLEHRIGKVGATGINTAPYKVDEFGDPNEGVNEPDVEKEVQFLIKWKTWSYIHCTWESKESLERDKAKGIKKIENYLKRIDEVKEW